MSEFKQIFIANSMYAEFLYLLRFPEKVDTTLFLVGPSCVQVDVPNRVPIVGPKQEANLPAYREFLSMQTYLLLRGKRVPCYGNVETIFSNFFVNNFPFYPITDGLWDVKKFPQYLMNPQRFPKCYAVKYPGALDIEDERLEYMNIHALWKKMTPAEQKRFADRFGANDKVFSKFSKRKILLVTQPLAEDKIIPEREKIALYQSILSQYDASEVIIKPHPRELTDWTKIFPDIPVAPRSMPVELLCLMMSHLEKMVTFYSTAACTVLPAEKVDFYAKDFDQLYMMDEGRMDGNVPLHVASFFNLELLKEKNHFNWLRLPDNHFYKG